MEPTINVQATAALVYSGKYCMVSLDEGSGAGITFGGNATVNLGCGVISNTTGASAVRVNGSASSVIASPVAAVGGVPESSVYKEPTLLLPYSLKQENPYNDGKGEPNSPEDISDPPPQTNCKPRITDATTAAQIQPGSCYRGLDVDGAKTLPPGTYYITEKFTLNSRADITARGVTFVFTKESTSGYSGSYPEIEINGGAKLNLTAPEDGPYKGIIMHYDSRAPMVNHTINGNSASIFEGAFYFPSQNLTYNGNSEMTTNCIQIVAYRITFEGNTKISNQCRADGGAKSFDAEWVRLVK